MIEEVLTADTRIAPSPKVYARAFGDDLVLLDFAAGEYFGLDRVGALVWERLLAGDALGAIAEAVEREYDVTLEAALADIMRLVHQLEASALVRRV